MKNNNKLEVVTLLFFVLVPFQGPILPRPHCPRDKASLVRKVVVKKWLPILERMGASLPLNCPLHPIRDVFAVQESMKVHSAPQWTCGFCGKSFYHEANVDAHMENKHSDKINQGDDSICFADFCDVMRCEVLLERLKELEESSNSGTALDVWHQPFLLSSRTFSGDQAVEKIRPRSLMRSPPANTWHKSSSSSSSYPKPSHREQTSHSTSSHSSSLHHDYPTSSPPSPPEDEEPGEVKKQIPQKSSCSGDPKDCQNQDDIHNESEAHQNGPEELPIHPLNSWKDSCNEEHLAELRVKCQQLIRQCISGLVLNLSLQQVKDIQGVLHRSVCWYLTCERYWETGSLEPAEFPVGVAVALVLLLSLGISLCYYVVWILCGSPVENNVTTPTNGQHPNCVREIPHTSRIIAEKKALGHIGLRDRLREERREAGSSSRANSLGRQMASRVPFNPGGSVESECKDSGFNEGGIYPDNVETETAESYVDLDSNSNRSRHYSEDSRLSLPPDSDQRYYMNEQRLYNYASTFTPNYEQRRLKRNRYNYLDDFDAYSELEADDNFESNDLSRERSDSFIYLSYPPEVKKKFTEAR